MNDGQAHYQPVSLCCGAATRCPANYYSCIACDHPCEVVDAAARAEVEAKVLEKVADAAPDGLNSLHKFRAWLRARAEGVRRG